MQLITQTVFCVVSLFRLVSPATCQGLPMAAPQQVGLSAEVFECIGPVVQKFIDEKQLAGAVTIVARSGKVVQFEAYGMMDLEAKKSMQRDTIFRIYSMTKPIVSVAVMMLCEEGKLELDTHHPRLCRARFRVGLRGSRSQDRLGVLLSGRIRMVWRGRHRILDLAAG